MFTRSRFAGPSVTISREHLADGRARAIVVVSKNANVANGAAGRADAEALVAAVAERLGCSPGDVLVASTGVIGRRYPLDRLLAGAAAIPCPLDGTDAVGRGDGDHDHRHRAQGRLGHGRRRPGWSASPRGSG